MRQSRRRSDIYGHSHTSRTLNQGEDRRQETRHLRCSTACTDRTRPATGSAQHHAGDGLAALVLMAGIYPDSVLELTRIACAGWLRMLELRQQVPDLNLAGSLMPV